MDYRSTIQTERDAQRLNDSLRNLSRRRNEDKDELLDQHARSSRAKVVTARTIEVNQLLPAQPAQSFRPRAVALLSYLAFAASYSIIAFAWCWVLR